MQIPEPLIKIKSTFRKEVFYLILAIIFGLTLANFAYGGSGQRYKIQGITRSWDTNSYIEKDGCVDFYASFAHHHLCGQYSINDYTAKDPGGSISSTPTPKPSPSK